MSVNGIGQSYYQNSVATMKSTKSVNSTKEFTVEKTSGTQELSEAEEMELFKKEFYEDLSKVTNHRTVSNAAVNISEAAFKAMKDDPQYREKVLSLIQRDWGDSYAPRNCSVLITVGTTLNEYRADSWPVGYDSEFDVRSQNSFYKRTRDKKDNQKDLLEEYLEKRAQAKELQQELLDEKIAKAEQERSRRTKVWNSERQMAKASSTYEANVMTETADSGASILEVFKRIPLEVSQLSQNREAILDRMKHTIADSVTSFSSTVTGILKDVREEKGQYGYSDVVNACGLSYARLYSKIEERYENGNEQYYKMDGTPLTMEEQIEWLDIQFEQEVAWQKSCARIAAQGQVFQWKIPEIPTKEIKELKNSLYQAKDVYMKLYRENRKAERPLVLQNYMFGNDRMYEVLNRLGNLQERVE